MPSSLSLLFCLHTLLFIEIHHEPELDASNHIRWILLAYIPQKTPVRDKMLYSSSRDDLKRGLGGSAFVGSLCSDCLEGVTYEEIQRCLITSNPDGPLTQLEKVNMVLVLGERTASPF